MILALPLLLTDQDNGFRLIFIFVLYPLIFGGVSFVAFAIGGTLYLRRCALDKIPLFSVAAPWLHAALQVCLHVLAVLSGNEVLMDIVLPGVGATPESTRTDLIFFTLAAILIGYLYVALALFLLFVFAGAGLTEWIGGRMWVD